MMDRLKRLYNQISGKFVVIGVCQHPFILDWSLRFLAQAPAMATIAATKATQILLLHISQLLALLGVFFLGKLLHCEEITVRWFDTRCRIRHPKHQIYETVTN